MALAEGVSVRLAYKAYATGVITANAIDNPATMPGAAGGQTLRRVSSTLALTKGTYQSAEIRTDYQIADFRHGIARVEGNIQGELSPATFMDFFEATHRDTRAATVTADNTTLTSVVASAAGGTFTFAAGDPVAAGFKVGGIVRFTGTATANDAQNFVILSFTGTNNRVLTVTPSPLVDISVADTTFSITQAGKSTIVPSSGFVRRKFALEVFHTDLNISRLYQECRVGSYRVQMPATGIATVEFTFMGRDEYDPVSGPYFTAPAAVTTTPVVTSVQGAVLRNGVRIGVITSADFTMNLTPSAAEVIGQNFPAEIFLGRNNLTGSISVFIDSNTMIQDFENENEIQILLYVTGSSAANAPGMTFFFPRVKLTSAGINITGEAGQSVTFNFQALKYVAATVGVPVTTIQIMDTDSA